MFVSRKILKKEKKLLRKMIFFMFDFTIKNIKENKIMDPAFWLMRFPLDGELDFDFEK